MVLGPDLHFAAISLQPTAYAYSDLNKSLWQIIDTFVPYCVLWALMLYTVRQGYPIGSLWRWLWWQEASWYAYSSFSTIAVTAPSLGHAGPTQSSAMSQVFDVHPVRQGDVDRQGVGDIWTMTKEKYLAAPRRKRLAYRIYRNPFVLFGPGPALLFLFFQRFSTKGAGKKERRSVLFANLALLAVIAVASSTIGFQTYLSIQLRMILIASTLGLCRFKFSINLKVYIGSAMNSGTPASGVWRVVLISSCRKSSNGSPATLVCITFITRGPRFPITICNSATMRSQRSMQSYH